MIIITGAAGFIGSNLVRKLNDEAFYDLVLVDEFDDTGKEKNLEGKRYTRKVERRDFIPWLREHHKLVQFVFHIGARTDTAEFDQAVFDELNLNYSKDVWKTCVEFGLPLVNASSAATYGDGSMGYSDAHEVTERLSPLNPYGLSKNDFDKWALAQEHKPYFWAGLKFFNVYGPNEYHKGRMASVVFHAFNQVKESGKVKLFRSHDPGFQDGFQMRDFIYVMDVADVCMFFLNDRRHSGIYNLGTGQARAFYHLAAAVFKALQQPENIEYIDMPLDIREKYQYFTEAKMEKLRNAGFRKPFHTLEDGVLDYVVNYLEKTACH